MQCLEVSGAVRPLYESLGVKWLNFCRLKYNFKVHCRLHKSPPLSLIVNQTNKLYIFLSN